MQYEHWGLFSREWFSLGMKLASHIILATLKSLTRIHGVHWDDSSRSELA